MKFGEYQMPIGFFYAKRLRLRRFEYVYGRHACLIGGHSNRRHVVGTCDQPVPFTKTLVYVQLRKIAPTFLAPTFFCALVC